MKKLIYILMLTCLAACSKPPITVEEKADETVILSPIDINDISNYYIVLNGKKFPVGSGVQSILDAGFTSLEQDGLVPAQTGDYMSLSYENEYVGLLRVFNNKQVEATAKECDITGFATFSDALITGMNFSTVNGVTFSMSRREIESIFGPAEDIDEENGEYEVIYYDDEVSKGYSFWFMNDKVEEIQMFFY